MRLKKIMQIFTTRPITMYIGTRNIDRLMCQTHNYKNFAINLHPIK